MKANVLFFDKSSKAKGHAANEIWIYDLRNDKNFSLKSNLIRSEDLKDFVACYNADDLNQRKETNKFRRFGYGDILRGEKANLDFRWQEGLSAVEQDNPQELMRQILDDLKEAVKEFSAAQNQIRN